MGKIIKNGIEYGGGGGSGTGGHTIVDTDGNPVADEPKLQFTGLDVQDNSTDSETEVAAFGLNTDSLDDIMSAGVAGNQVASNGLVYSTTEQIVGKWIDGKPIYQKTYNETITTYIDYGHRRMFLSSAIPNVETMVNCNNVYFDEGDNEWYGSTFTTSSTAQGNILQRNVFAYVNPASHELTVRHQSDTSLALTSVTFICTVQYTKITD